MSIYMRHLHQPVTKLISFYYSNFCGYLDLIINGEVRLVVEIRHSDVKAVITIRSELVQFLQAHPAFT